MEYIRNDKSKVEFTTIIEDKENATIFKHFKGSTHQIITVAKHSETLEDLVIYTHDDGIWARPIDMFFETVDKEKYPDVDQTYRFEIIKTTKVGN